jgi:hypothetical protein
MVEPPCTQELHPGTTDRPEIKKQIRDHALPSEGFGLGTPEGEEGWGVTPGNTGRGQQREGTQATVHQTSSKHTFTNRHDQE